MKVISRLFNRVITSLLILTLIGIPEISSAQSQTTSEQNAQPVTAPSQVSPQQPAPGTNSSATSTSDQQAQPQPNLPNSPGAVQSQTSPRQANSTERPIGTAAAEIGNASGTAASKPAGVAIAPAKQRQSRSLLIKIGAIVGVGVAVGTVMALSNASPSRPPGSQSASALR